MMEERRGRLRLEIVCHAAARLQTKNKRRGSKLDPVQISTTSVYDVIKCLLVSSDDGWEEVSPSWTKPSEDELVRKKIEEFIPQGLGVKRLQGFINWWMSPDPST